MQSEKNSRLDTRELKAQLLKNVGQENFKRYFHNLNRFINQKLSKSEFDKSCYRILGRENLSLHNQIIKAILKNACSAKTPPSQSHIVGPTIKASTCSEDGHGQHRSSVSTVWSNGVVSMSPRKGRSTIRDRKLGDRIRPLGPNGKSLEDGELPHYDYQRPLHKLQGPVEKTENDNKLVIKEHKDVLGVGRNNYRSNAFGIEDGEMEHAKEAKFSRSRLIAPLGIPYCSASTGGSRKVLPVRQIGDYHRCLDFDGLPDSEMLRRRMEQNAASQELGVTLECANTLNKMVDVYLKRLISSGLELVISRSTSDMSVYPAQKQQIPGKPINGLWPSNHMHIQNSESVSLLDFKVAMELNPQQLGGNWPLLLEKISMQGFEE